MNLLEVDNLSVEFVGKQSCHALRKLRFTLPRNGTLGIVGESGSGKSTIALALMGLLPPQGRLRSGRALWSHQDQELDLLENAHNPALVRGQSIALVSQNPGLALNPYLRVETQLCEHLLRHRKCGHKQAQAKALELLEAVQIDDPVGALGSYPHQFSGGQQQRIAIAMALMTSPVLLIADEPTTALDTTVQAQVLELFSSLRRALGMAMIFISHDLRVIAQVADQILVMHDGRAVEQGTLQQILYDPATDYTKRLCSVLPMRASRRTGKRDSAPQELLVDARDLCYSVRARPGNRKTKPILRHVDLRVPRGQIVGVVGESGAGKSTLARALLRLVPLESGSIAFDKQFIHQLSPAEMLPLRARMQMVFQNPYTSLNPRRTVYETLHEALDLHRVVPANEIGQRIAALLEEVELPSNAQQRYPHQFSGGQCQRISIARAISTQPELLIADEPLSALDISTQAQIMSLLQRLVRERGLTIILITHDLSVVLHLCTQIAVMHRGTVVEYGRSDDIFVRPQQAHTEALLKAMPQLPKQADNTPANGNISVS